LNIGSNSIKLNMFPITFLLWHGVFAAFVKWIAPQHPFETQPPSLYHAMALDGLVNVVRASRAKAAETIRIEVGQKSVIKR
jgi:hypothetical protein